MSRALQNPDNWPGIVAAARELKELEDAMGFAPVATMDPCAGVISRQQAEVLLGESLAEPTEILADANEPAPVIEVSSRRYDFWSRVLEFGRNLLRME